MIDVIQHYRPLVLLAAYAESTSNRRMLAVKENVGKSQPYSPELNPVEKGQPRNL
jgi:hypothetical protein